MNFGGIADTLPGVGVAAGGAGAGYFLVKLLFDTLTGRVDKREAAVEAGSVRLDAATQRLITRLEEEITDLSGRMRTAEHELDECRRRDVAREAEVARLKATMQGWGDARDHAQAILAAQRLIDKGAN